MINVKNIYWMLAYAFRNINIDEIKKVEAENFDNIYDLFCVMLTQGIGKQIKRGLNKEYILKINDISGVKGKINLSDTVKKNSMVNKKIICEFDEYSENSYLNKIIKTTAFYIIKSNKIKNKNRKNNLKKMMLYFSNIDILDIKTIKWSQIKYNRNNASYKFLINICKFILEGLLINKEKGKIEFLDFIDDQALYYLYEKFILEYFKYHYSEFSVSSPQIKWNIKENNFIEFFPIMQSDIMLKYKEKKLIIDAKYYSKTLQKKYDKETYRNNNINQIFTYVKNEDYQDIRNVAGMLLYAKTTNEDIGWKEVTMVNSKIIITNLDLSQNFEVIQERMEEIADWLKNKFKKM